MKRVGDLADPKVAALYAQVPADRLAQFQAFRRDFPYCDLSHVGQTWSYLAGGQGDPPLLLLSGALVIPDISWTSIAGLAAARRVIAPAYPPVSSMDALVDGIAAILRREGIGQAHVMGGSYGGFVAQVFVRRHPDLARSLVLSHTRPPEPDTTEQMRRSVRLLRLLPMPILRRMIRRSFGSLMPERTDDTACMLAIYDELVGCTLGKRDVVAILERMVDFSPRRFAPGDLAGWQGKVLLVFGENDPASPPEIRQRLAALYPGSQVHIFAGAGHATSVTHVKEYQAVIEGFLAQP